MTLARLQASALLVSGLALGAVLPQIACAWVDQRAEAATVRVLQAIQQQSAARAQAAQAAQVTSRGAK